MAYYEFSLQDVMKQLNAKIQDLETKRDQLAEQVRLNPGDTTNVRTLAQMNQKLVSAYEGKKFLMDCCCNVQWCNYEMNL